jgi:hypothetical protein
VKAANAAETRSIIVTRRGPGKALFQISSCNSRGRRGNGVNVSSLAGTMEEELPKAVGVESEAILLGNAIQLLTERV